MIYDDATARGWRVFPLRAGSKQPAVRDWETWATTEPDPIWWSEADQGYGIACGPSNLIVVDLDLKPKYDGIRNWVELCKRIDAQVPVTYSVETPSGGVHFYFTQPRDIRLRNTAGKLGEGIDTRGWGGYVVGYPPVDDHPPAPCPRWLVAAISAAQPRPTSNAAPVSPSRFVLQSSRYGTRALSEEMRIVASAPEGQRNHTLNKAAYRMGQLVTGLELAFDEALAGLVEAGLACGLSQFEVDRTVESGMNAGMSAPRKRL